MTKVEEQLSRALTSMASHVTDAQIHRMVLPPPRRQATAAGRWLAVAGATALVAVLAVVPSIVRHRSDRGVPPATSQVESSPSGPDRFVAVNSATKELGLYDARTGRRLQDVPWPQGGSVTALASSGDGENFVGAANTGACSAELRTIAVSLDATGTAIRVGPVIATLPGQTASIAETADGSSIAATLSCGDGSSSKLAVVDAGTGAVRLWSGAVYDNAANGISISRDGRRLAFLASLPRTGMYVLDISSPVQLSEARLVPTVVNEYNFPVLHLPRFINDGSLVVGTEGEKHGPNDEATYTLTAISPETGELKVLAVMPARGWTGLAVDPTGRHSLARIGEQILRIDDGRVSVVSKNTLLFPIVW